jgi:hypothetical protein
MQDIKTEILITEMVVSNEAKNVVPLKFLLKIEKKNFSSCEFNPRTYGISNKHNQFFCYYSRVKNKLLPKI